MRSITLAGVPAALSEVVLGTMTFGQQVAAPEAERMVGQALEKGITAFDTSNNYAGGMSERILGRALGAHRDSVVLSTKGGSHVDQADASLAGLGRAALTAAVEGSLERLGTDRIDVYYLHRPDRAVAFDETLEALRDLVAGGKVLRVAQSNFAAWQVVELNAIAAKIGAPALGISQTMYNLVSRRVESEYAECSDYLGLTDIAYNPLAGGLLTGKHRLRDEPAEGSRFAKELYRQRYWNEPMFHAVDRLRDVAGRAGLSLVELSLRWVAQQGLTDAVLLGASSVEQFEANLAALQGPDLDEQTLDGCDEVWRQLDAAVPQYNR